MAFWVILCPLPGQLEHITMTIIPILTRPPDSGSCKSDQTVIPSNDCNHRSDTGLHAVLFSDADICKTDQAMVVNPGGTTTNSAPSYAGAPETAYNPYDQGPHLGYPHFLYSHAPYPGYPNSQYHLPFAGNPNLPHGAAHAISRKISTQLKPDELAKWSTPATFW